MSAAAGTALSSSSITEDMMAASPRQSEPPRNEKAGPSPNASADASRAAAAAEAGSDEEIPPANPQMASLPNGWRASSAGAAHQSPSSYVGGDLRAEGGGGSDDLPAADTIAYSHRGSSSALSSSYGMLMTLDEDADEELSSGEQLPQENTHFFPHNTLLRVGIVVEAISSTEAGVVAASSPEESSIIAAVGRSSISNCCVTSFVVLDNKLQQGQNSSSQEAIAREWLEHSGCSPSPDKVRILYGPTGLEVVLDNPTLVDAVLVLTSASTQHMYVMQALRARKHVLFYDRVSQPLHEFQEQLKLAFRVGRFLQSSTMFVHHHRVKVFMACVNNEKTFGNLESIHAKLLVNYDDASRIMGAKFPLARRGDGCVRRLGRYCVLITSLLLSRAGSRPVSAHVVPRYEHEDDKEPTEAKGTVTFTGNRVLTFHVAYTSIATRQILEVHAPTRYATMTDFVLPHRDGLATYRVYHKDVVPLSGKLEVVKAESLDVMSGPPQDVMMWRDFSILCDAVERYGYSSPQAAGSRELASVANCTKRVLLALEESIATGREVPVAVEEVVL